ncbi:hypothetical protein ABIB38_001363 [Massilia sp. UYP11]|uniref:hypothetical protein n=1 Tax=Massilia sp. UYP11 TaxID=1756385 RepID=UPI003D25D2ED
MLTSTYTLVALSVEQARARIEVQALLERWRPCAWWGEPPAMPQYEQACDALRQVCDACHWRKLDKFVLPALRRCGEDAARLVAELDGLSRQALEARRAAQAAAVDGDPGCLAALERCCELLLERLDREERELLPLARTMIPGEAWFAIANQMLAHDAHQSENRGDGRGADLGIMRGLPPAELSSRKNHALPLAN